MVSGTPNAHAHLAVAVGSRVRAAGTRRVGTLAARLAEARRPRVTDPPPAEAELRMLVVCHGNICRSAIAHGVLRSKLVARGLAGRVAVASAGTSGENVGRPADGRARLAVARHGGNIGDLRARTLADYDLASFHLILVMDEDNRRDVLSRVQTARDAAKVRLILDYVDGGEVQDPVHGTRADFERVYVVLERACEAVVQAIATGMRHRTPPTDASLRT
jgi:protein-tyrosine phosphatase